MKRFNLFSFLAMISLTVPSSFLHAQSEEYLQTVSWFTSQRILINDPAPPAGYEKSRDCDSNIVFKKVTGDTIRFFSWAAVTPAPFEDIIKLQKRPYFNSTVYPRKVQEDGSVLIARLVPKTFLLRHDSLYLLDNTLSRIANTFKMLDDMESFFATNIDSLSADLFGFAGSAAFRAQDAADLDNFNGTNIRWRSKYPPYFKLIYCHNMFETAHTVTLKRKPILFEGKKAATSETLDLIEVLEQDGKRSWLIRFNPDPNLGQLSDSDDFTFTTNGKFLTLENCQVDIK